MTNLTGARHVRDMNRDDRKRMAAEAHAKAKALVASDVKSKKGNDGHVKKAPKRKKK